MQPNGFKVRRCRKGPQRRPKSWVECQSKRGKRVQTQRAPYKGPHNQVSEAKELPTQLLDGVSCSAPPTYEAPQTQDGQFSFTAYLMTPLNDTDIGRIGDIGVDLLGDGNQLDMDGGPPVDGVRRRNNVWRWPVAYDEATVVAGERSITNLLPLLIHSLPFSRD
ncbi:hypothetical protein P8452_32969 [Trifolium repens]|nr:hypothetical protein P8452_32969 [Trifolium repens]